MATIRATTLRTTMPIDNENDMSIKYFVFPELNTNYKNFPDYSRFSLTFCKNGLFSRFSRFSMNPGIVPLGQKYYDCTIEAFFKRSKYYATDKKLSMARIQTGKCCKKQRAENIRPLHPKGLLA